ncbi:MAG TPA: hypothetical protein VK453_27655 [Micromonosporaceae bacterium]|nr:hypothetical protein [Micromonosporaceae bacterium]
MVVRPVRLALIAGVTLSLVAAGVVTATHSSAAPACGTGSFNAEAVRSGNTWTSRNGSRTVYTGSDMRSAMLAALNSLTPNRRTQQRVVVRGSGDISANVSVQLQSYTTLDVCGTINVTGTGTGDRSPLYARNATNIEITHVRMTGTPVYGIFMRSVANLTLREIDLRLSRGLGIRIDNFHNRAVLTRNTVIENVYVSGTSDNGVETAGLDGVRIGTVVARNTGHAGLLLNSSINVTVGSVDGSGAGTGTGYAAFRMANRNGRVGNSYPTNIRVGSVKARGGGRGIFCVSESGGAVIDHVDLMDTGGHAILLENCHNTTIAAVSGTVGNGEEIRIASRTQFAASSGNVIQNLTVRNTPIRLSPCGSRNVIRNVTRVNSSLSWC